MFLTIGAFTVFGSGQLLDGNSVEFSNKLLAVFTSNLGSWSYWILAIAAFGTIYGTLIVSMDAFARSFVLGMSTLFDAKSDNMKENSATRYYTIILIIITVSGFLLSTRFPGGMIRILEIATICIFLMAPIIAFLNVKLIRNPAIPATHRPGKMMFILAVTGLLSGRAFTSFYLFTLIK
jgi:Mn2+/Fe2+ NRAMP family transporter